MNMYQVRWFYTDRYESHLMNHDHFVIGNINDCNALVALLMRCNPDDIDMIEVRNVNDYSIFHQIVCDRDGNMVYKIYQGRER